MALNMNYLVSTKNLENFIDAVLGAQAPEKFTNKFINDLGFTSSNDRLYIGLFKSLGLLDDNSVPTQKYYNFLDETRYKKVLADCIRESYNELFNINKNANKLDATEIKNKFKTLTQGKKTDKVLTLMTSTFKALCDLADFSTHPSVNEFDDSNKVNEKKENTSNMNITYENDSAKIDTSLHYDFHIHLPETRDDAVYDAIFKSMKRYLYK